MCIIYCWLIPNLSDLWLMFPELVLISPFLPFMISVLGAFCTLLWSCLPSVIFFPALTPLIWLIWDLVLMLTTMVCIHQCACCIWIEYPAMLNWVWTCEHVLQLFISFCLILSEVLVCHFWCLADVSCVVCNQSTHLCYPHYVWPPTVICAGSLYNIFHTSMVHNPHTSEILQTIQEKTESLQVSLHFKYLSCHALRAS